MLSVDLKSTQEAGLNKPRLEYVAAATYRRGQTNARVYSSGTLIIIYRYIDRVEPKVRKPPMGLPENYHRSIFKQEM